MHENCKIKSKFCYLEYIDWDKNTIMGAKTNPLKCIQFDKIAQDF